MTRLERLQFFDILLRVVAVLLAAYILWRLIRP